MPATMIAFTFPGQGAQQPGMGAGWVDHPSWELVSEASEATDRDLTHLLLHADADELLATRNNQIATVVASLVVLDAVERIGLEPAVHAGHSLGEYTALIASGAVSFEDGLRLVAERGDAMQAADDEHTGKMAAVLGLDDGKVEDVCDEVDGDVWITAYNAPGQIVIAGAPDAVDEASRLAMGKGAKKVAHIPVQGAFHTPYMAPARDRLVKAIDATDFRDPDLPVVANIDALAHAGADDWPPLLREQLCHPVRWRQSLYTLDEMGVTTFVELGGSAVLTGLTTRTLGRARTASVSTPQQLDLLLETLQGHEHVPGGRHEGEHLFATERVVVSPSAGIFDPDPSLTPGLELVPGQVLGRVGEHEVHSAFTGSVIGVLAVPGERVTLSQPIAWLRTA